MIKTKFGKHEVTVQFRRTGIIVVEGTGKTFLVSDTGIKAGELSRRIQSAIEGGNK